MRTAALLLLLAATAVIVALEGTGPHSGTTPRPVREPAQAGTTPPMAPDPPDLPPAPEPRFAPADLFSPNNGRALAAASRLDPGMLTLEELRRQQSILVEHPAVYFESRAGWGICNRELPRLLLRTAEEGVVYLDGEGRPRLIDTHRVWLPSTMNLLVEALGRAGPDAFPHFLEYLNLVSRVSGEGRESAAHGFLYGIERQFRAARGGRPDSLAAFYVDRLARGLPEAFVRLARFTWLDPDSRTLLSDRLWPLPSPIFLLRWGRELRPLPSDVPFLVDLAAPATVETATLGLG